MASVSTKQTINASPDAVWSTLSSFREIEKYLPMITKSEVSGSGLGAKRTCYIPDEHGKEGKIEEEIKSFDEPSKTLSYAVLSSPLPVENFLGTIKVADLGNNSCQVEWGCSFESKGMPEEDVSKMLTDIFNMAQGGLKKIHEK